MPVCHPLDDKPVSIRIVVVEEHEEGNHERIDWPNVFP